MAKLPRKVRRSMRGSSKLHLCNITGFRFTKLGGTQPAVVFHLQDAYTKQETSFATTVDNVKKLVEKLQEALDPESFVNKRGAIIDMINELLDPEGEYATKLCEEDESLIRGVLTSMTQNTEVLPSDDMLDTMYGIYNKPEKEKEEKKDDEH